MKLLAIGALILCLVEPLFSDKRPRAGANLFVLLVDNSQSMSAQDRRGTPNRGDQVKTLLSSESNWQTRLSQDFDVRWYGFDTRLNAITDATELSFDGTSSSLASALGTLSDRFRDRTVAGVLLLTDGIATDSPPDSNAAKNLLPVFPVVIGQDRAVKDIRIQDLSVSQTNFEESPVTLRAEVEHDGYAGVTLIAELRTRQGTLLETQTMPAAEEGARPCFAFSSARKSAACRSIS